MTQTPSNQEQETMSQADKILSMLEPEQREVVARRRAVCELCDHQKELHTLAVICKAGGCSGISWLLDVANLDVGGGNEGVRFFR